MTPEPKANEKMTVHFLLLSFVLLITACRAAEPKQDVGGERVIDDRSITERLSREDALREAKDDASRVYKDLSQYRVEATLQEDGWHVDYVLRDDLLDGGGAHYLIDDRTGQILRKKYEQ